MGFLETKAKAGKFDEISKAHDLQNAQMAQEYVAEQQQARALVDAEARKREQGLAHQLGLKQGIEGALNKLGSWMNTPNSQGEMPGYQMPAQGAVNTQMNTQRPAVQPSGSGVLDYFKGLVK